MFDLHSILLGFKTLFLPSTYGETLERYITSRMPKDTSDIERLTIEWQRGQIREKLL